MKFKIDENLPATAAGVLRLHGHDVLLVLDQVDPGTSDAIVSEMIRRESRILVTLDLDFADIRTYRPSEFAGIMVLRPRQLSAPSVLTLVERLAVALETQSPVGRDGSYICSSDGGLIGTGDGKCQDFSDVRTDERRVWADDR